MPQLISQPDSPPACLMGRNGIKKKTPSGSISALMRRWGRGLGGGDKATTIATPPSERAGSFRKGRVEVSRTNGALSTTHCEGCLATAIPTGYPPGIKCNNTPHTPCWSSNSSYKVNYIHGRENVPITSPNRCQWFHHRQPTGGRNIHFQKDKIGVKFYKLQIGDSDVHPSVRPYGLLQWFNTPSGKEDPLQKITNSSELVFTKHKSCQTSLERDRTNI